VKLLLVDCTHLLKLQPLPHLEAAPVASDDGGQCVVVALRQGAVIAVVGGMQSPHSDHVAPAVTRLTEIHSNLHNSNERNI
jgi:hypothetical protein